MHHLQDSMHFQSKMHIRRKLHKKLLKGFKLKHLKKESNNLLKLLKGFKLLRHWIELNKSWNFQPLYKPSS